MKHTLVLVALMATSCAQLARWTAPTQPIDAATAGPLILAVCAQHDESVARDGVLVEAEKAQALRMTAQLREIVELAGGGGQ